MNGHRIPHLLIAALTGELIYRNLVRQRVRAYLGIETAGAEALPRAGSTAAA